MSAARAHLLWLVVLTACSGQAVFTFTEQSAAAIDGGLAPVSATALPATVNLIVTGPNYAIASTAQGPYRLVSGEDPEAMMLVLSADSDGGIENPGALSAAVSRNIAPTTPVTSVIAVASAGVVQDFADVFELSSLSTSLSGSVTALDDVGGTTVPEVVWAGVNGALFQITNGLSQRYAVASESGGPSAVLAAGPSRTFAAFGTHLYDLDPVAGALTQIDHDFGNVVGMVRGVDGGSYLAGDQGLFVVEADGLVSHYPIGSVSGLTVDPLFGVYAAIDGTLLAMPFGGQLSYVGTFPDDGPHPLATDGFGNVWAGSGSNVLEFQAGTTVGYVNDIKPFFAANCYACHVTGSQNDSPRLPLDDYDGTKALSDSIVQHLTGDGVPVMPPAPPVGSGPLDPSVYGVVIRWVNTGELP